MIFLFPLALVAVFLVVTGRRYPLGAYLGLLWLVALWVITYTSHQMRGYFASDEIYFATEPLGDLLSNRFLWLLLNQFVGLFVEQPEDIVSNMRVVNLSFLVTIYLYAATTIRTIPPFLLAIAMSYFACVAALNLRDPAILLGTWMFLNSRVRLGHTIRDQITALKHARLAVVLLILLRPLQFTQLFISGFRLIYISGFIALFLAFLQTPLGSQYFYKYVYFYNNYETVVAERAEDMGFVGVKPTAESVAFWMARFAFAPTPPAITRRFVIDRGEYDFGKVDLGVRVINRYSLFACYISLVYYLAIYWRLAIAVLKRNAFIIKFGFMFSFTYAIFNLGGSHERIKLNLLILMLMLLDRIRIELREYRKAS